MRAVLYLEPVPKAIELAVLCDAATFRDDLLSVLGAGITTLTAEVLPALAELTLVAQLAFTEPDIGSKETLVIEAKDEAGERLASMTFALTPERPPDADLAFPYVFTLIHRLTLRLTGPGLYTVAVSLEGVAPKQLLLRVKT